MKISEIVGKKIFGEGGRQGYVVSVGELNGEIYLRCADGNEREFAVKMESVYQSGGNILFGGGEAENKSFYALRLGRACYDMKGNYLGRLNDCTIRRGKLTGARIGKKNYPAGELIFGDAVLVKEVRRLNADVVKNGKTLFKKGTCVTDGLLGEAAAQGEYVQTTLKSI